MYCFQGRNCVEQFLLNFCCTSAAFQLSSKCFPWCLSKRHVGDHVIRLYFPSIKDGSFSIQKRRQNRIKSIWYGLSGFISNKCENCWRNWLDYMLSTLPKCMGIGLGKRHPGSLWASNLIAPTSLLIDIYDLYEKLFQIDPWTGFNPYLVGWFWVLTSILYRFPVNFFYKIILLLLLRHFSLSIWGKNKYLFFLGILSASPLITFLGVFSAFGSILWSCLSRHCQQYRLQLNHWKFGLNTIPSPLWK